jgi:hypothetical protein
MDQQHEVDASLNAGSIALAAYLHFRKVTG